MGSHFDGIIDVVFSIIIPLKVDFGEVAIAINPYNQGCISIWLYNQGCITNRPTWYFPGVCMYNYYLYYSTSSLTNQIAPFEGNNVGYCTLLWQCIMMPDNNLASFKCRACVHAAQYSQWLSSRDGYRWQRRTIIQASYCTTQLGAPSTVAQATQLSHGL